MEREPDRQPERDRRGKDGREDRENGDYREDFLRRRDNSNGSRATVIPPKAAGHVGRRVFCRSA